MQTECVFSYMASLHDAEDLILHCEVVGSYISAMIEKNEDARTEAAVVRLIGRLTILLMQDQEPIVATQCCLSMLILLERERSAELQRAALACFQFLHVVAVRVNSRERRAIENIIVHCYGEKRVECNEELWQKTAERFSERIRGRNSI